ncbi:MAG: TlpA family protein disulfide reductase [Chloroflexi bacterium]|nr:TlpA family protein disulfide reductase [Chloroflexota bacterium]
MGILAVVAILLVVPLGSTPGGTPPPGASAEPSGVTVGGSPLMGKPAPAFTLTDLDGTVVSLADFRGTPLIVNFWASWCVPCREEFPMLVGAYGEHRGELAVVGIIRRDGAESARAFAASEGATWPMLMDPDEAAWRDYLGVGVPQTYFIDADGVVRWVNIGPFNASGLAFGLSRILPATPGATGPDQTDQGPTDQGSTSGTRHGATT